MSDLYIPENPLTQEQKAELMEAQRIIPLLKQQILRAETAGIDVTAQKQELSTLEKQVKKLLSVYG